MKIVFWGGNAAHVGTTSNMLLVALAAAQTYQYKTLMVQCRFDLNTIEGALVDRKQRCQIKEEYSYLRNRGIDYLIHKSKFCELTEEVVQQVLVPVWCDRAFYIPSSEKLHKELFEKNLFYHIKNISTVTERFADFTCFDAGSSYGELTEEILKYADRIIVTLPQNPAVLDSFFSRRQKFQEKMLYLIGNYDYHSTYNAGNIQRIYRIPKDRLGVIPYNVRFQNAFYQGSLIRFLGKNLNCKRFHENYYFVKELLASVKKIIHPFQNNIQ